MSGRRRFLLLVLVLGALLTWLLMRRRPATALQPSEYTGPRHHPSPPAAPARQEPPPPEPDDLKRIRGIGPVLEQTLHRLGITTFRQIALFTPDDIQRVSRELGEFRSRIERDGWIQQARDLHEASYGERL